MKRLLGLVTVAAAIFAASCDSDTNNGGNGGDDAVVADGPGADGADALDVAGDEGLREEVGGDDTVPEAVTDEGAEAGDPGCAGCDAGDVANDEGTAEVTPSCPGGYLCPCTKNDNCLSNLCVQDVEGMVCSRTCDGEDSCPDGWSCSVMAGTGGDTIYVCVNPHSTRCRPCRTDAECTPPEGAGDARYGCVAHGDTGSFCGRGCATADDCPRGYGCVDSTTASGSGKYCVPADGADCACPGYFVQKGFLTTCKVANEAGTCKADRTCDQECGAKVPAAETCNGADDNCNGSTDEGLSGVACQNTNEWGSCTGTAACLEGTPSCIGQTPKQEICNGTDDDCDTVVDEEGASGCTEFYRDDDQDRYGRDDDHKCLCAAKGTYTAAVGGDCDDGKAAVNPAAAEVCNGIDDDCDLVADPAGAGGCTKVYRDEDQDTYGVAGTETCLCVPAAPFTAARDGDCDDGATAVNPGATEACNGLDDDCDTQADETGADGCTTYFKDADRDGYGLAADSRCLCAAAAPYDATADGDCGDTDLAVNPGATEVCNGKDDDCDTKTDEEGAADCTTFYIDNDGDGWGVELDSRCLCAAEGKYTARKVGDCNDSDGGICPGATEVCNNKDDDCNGGIDEDGTMGCTTLYLDVDADSWGAIGSARCLCPSQVPAGYTATVGRDCDDVDYFMNPGATELCNEKDDDCDGSIDEAASDCTVFYRDHDLDGYGVLADVKCLCKASGEYTATKPGDCCDIDAAANPDRAAYSETANLCGSFDWNCDGSANFDPSQGTGGGCKSWPGCGEKQGFTGSGPACGQSGSYVTGGCSLSCVYKCCDADTETRIRKCI